ncbi:hypothetical protein [Geodermatophilus sp. SYSU D00710]
MSTGTARSARPAPTEEESRRIAGLVGPALVAITASEAVNLDLVRRQHRTDSYLDGSVVFVAGLALVRAHGHWVRGWPVLITLTGWAALLGGLARMFSPGAEEGDAGAGAYAAIAVPFAVGVHLTARAYWPAAGAPRHPLRSLAGPADRPARRPGLPPLLRPSRPAAP